VRATIKHRQVARRSCLYALLLFVSAGEQRRRHSQPECLRGFQVDNEFVPGRRLHRQVGGLLAFEDTVDVRGRAPMQVDSVGPVGDETSIYD
jgi:hypothetical protein